MSIHSYDVAMAQDHGVISAVIYYQIEQLCMQAAAEAQGITFGRPWVKKSIPDFQRLLPEFTYDQVRRGIDRLLDADIILAENFHEEKNDRTKWYSDRLGNYEAFYDNW